MNLADALRRVNSEGQPVAQATPTKPSQSSQDVPKAAKVKKTVESASQGQSIPAAEQASFTPTPDHTVEPPHSHVNGNVVRLEIFLNAEQMGGLFRAIMAGQHSVLTLREAAAYLRISQDSLLRLAEEGEIPAVHIENRWRFPKPNLDDWLTLQSTTAEDSEDVA